MATPEFGDVVYNITDITVAPLNAITGVYGTPYGLTYGSKMSFQAKHDTDMVKAYGLAAELLSILVNLEGELEQAAIDAVGMYTLTGTNSTSSSSTPTRIATEDIVAGGAGLPYFGAIGNFAAVNGSNVLVGLRKCMLDEMPAFTVEQNKFRLSNVKFKGIAIDVTTRKVYRVRRQETAAVYGSDSTAFNAFFA